MEGKEAMTTKDKILSRLKANSEALLKSGSNIPDVEMPDFSLINPTEYADPLVKFRETAKKVSGANVVESEKEGDLNKLIRELYPEAKIFGSNLTFIEADINPDSVPAGKDLMKVDVGVIEGSFGVAENGCIWIPQTMKERALCFASENLVILLHKKDIVNNMHEAYDLIDKKPEYFEPYKFGTFISGPSKTADIESALVYGAQAARGVTVILL